MNEGGEVRAHSVPRPRRWSRLALAAAAVALLAALLGASAGLGTRWGIWNFRTGFDLLRWAAYLGVGAVILGVVAAFRTRPGGSRRGFAAAAAALLLALVVIAIPWYNRRLGASVPAIHDITTDTENPPAFVAIVPLRADAPNPVDYPGPEVAELQRAAYPDIRPVILDLPVDRAFQRAYDIASDRWRIVEADPATGRIEAVDRTFWFGFRDDVVIRLTPLEGRTVVDVRSKSRVGRSDLGTNARRVRRYLQALPG